MALTTSTAEAVTDVGLDADTLKMMLEAIRDFVADAMSEERQLQLDHDDVCPEDIVHGMCSDQLGIQLVFIPEEYGGMGGGTIDVYRVCEQMARIDLGLATSVLATFLGSDPIYFGATPDQKRTWLSEIADKGILYAYGATEPEAGSDLGALKTTATPATDGGVEGYRLNGRKQWISNGGIADKYTILALAPGGPSWFVLDRGTEGFAQAKPEDKHGIRLSNTAALFLDNVFVPADEPGRRRRRAGPRAGAEGLRLHAPDGRVLRPRRRLVGTRPRDPVLDHPHPGAARRCRQSRATRTSSSSRTPSGWRPPAPTSSTPPGGSTRAKAKTGPSTPKAPSPSTWRPRRATRPPKRPSRPTAATATRASTWSRRSSATSGSPRSTKAPPRSWR